MTVNKLLNGVEGPLSTWEFNHWMAFFDFRAKEEEKAAKKK